MCDFDTTDPTVDLIDRTPTVFRQAYQENCRLEKDLAVASLEWRTLDKSLERSWKMIMSCLLILVVSLLVLGYIKSHQIWVLVPLVPSALLLLYYTFKCIRATKEKQEIDLLFDKVRSDFVSFDKLYRVEGGNSNKAKLQANQEYKAADATLTEFRFNPKVTNSSVSEQAQVRKEKLMTYSSTALLFYRFGLED